MAAIDALAKDFRFVTGPNGGSGLALSGDLARSTIEDSRHRAPPGGIGNVVAVEAGIVDLSLVNIMSAEHALNGMSGDRCAARRTLR